MTTTEQLALILPWINGDLSHDVAVRRALWRFIEARGRTGVLRNPNGFQEASDLVDSATAGDLEAVRQKVEKVLARGVGRPMVRHDPRGKEDIRWEDLLPEMTFPSLRFGIRKGSMEVGGPLGGAMRLRDLVPFLVLLLMASPDLKGKRALRWCDSPAPGSWRHRCGRLFVWGGQGRPKEACSPACITRRRDQGRLKDEQAARKRRRKR